MKSPTHMLQTLERIDESIKIAWLKDLDKTAEMNELIAIQKEMLNRQSIMEYFNSKPCFDYFVNKFSKEVIMNLLRQNCVYGVNGDDIVLQIFINFLKIWMKFHKDTSLAPLFENIRELIKSNNAYYKSQMQQYRVINKKKSYDAEVFNETLPKNKETLKDYVQGDIVDVLINYKESRNIIDQKAWVRGKIVKIENGNYIITICEPNGIICYKIGSLNVLPCGVATKDWDWRINLNQWDVIDCYDRGNWYPSTVCTVNQTQVNDQPKRVYRIGFRLYPELFLDYKRYFIFWQQGTSRDSNGKEYIGDRETLDESITFYSNRIQKPNTKINFESAKNGIHYYSANVMGNEEYSNFYVDSLYLYENEGTKHYIVGKGNNFCYYYALLLNSFAKEDGYNEVIKMLESKPSAEDMMNIFDILTHSIPYLHQGYFKEMGERIFKASLDFFRDITNEDMRHLKRDLLELIGKVLVKIEESNNNKDQTSDINEEITLTISLKMIKTTIFDKRLQGIKALNDFIKANRGDKSKLSKTIQLIQDNGIINEIFGANSHSQIISKATDIVKLLLEEDKLTESDINFIWGGTQKGDLEGKINILTLLSETSSLLQPKHVDLLLSSIYSHIDSDLNSTEIDLVYNLSIQNNNEANIERCITFLTQCLLNSTNKDETKLNNIIAKVINITNLFDKHTNTVLSLCVKCIETNSHVILSYKILSKYLDSFSKKEAVVNLISNNKLLNLFIKNWEQYSNVAKDYLKANKLKSTENNDRIVIDSFSHEDNISTRVSFLFFLIDFYPNFNTINFLYEMLIKDQISSHDLTYLFLYCEHTIDEKKSEVIINQLYDLITSHLSNDSRFINSMNAFNVFIKIFLALNSKNNHIIYFPSSPGMDSKLSLSSLIDPENMIGFGILWKIIFEATNNDIMLKGIEILHKLFSSINHLDKLLQKCIMLIKEEQQLNNESLSRNKIKKGLKILSTIIEESELKGSGSVKSHYALCKKGIIKLRIFVKSKISNFDLNLFLNTTISEIRDICAQRTKINRRFLKLANSSNEEISNTKNGRTLFELGIQNNEELILSISNSTARADLISNDKINPKFEAIVSEWFDTYSIDGKMTKDTCAKFTTAVTITKEPMHRDDNRINYFFNRYDMENRGYLLKEDFIFFYTNSARTKPDVVWDNLTTMHINYDLDDTRKAIQVETIDEAMLPRYQLSLNADFFYGLFNLFGSEDLDLDLYDFLYTLSTNSELYKNLLSKDKIDYWSNTNSPLGEYLLHIIQSIIEDIELSIERSDLSDDYSCKTQEKIEWIIRLIKSGGLKNISSYIGYIIQKSDLFINRMLIVSSIMILKTFIRFSLYDFRQEYEKILNVIQETKEDEAQEKGKDEEDFYNNNNSSIVHYFRENNERKNQNNRKENEFEYDSLLKPKLVYFDNIMKRNQLEYTREEIDYSLSIHLIDYTWPLVNSCSENDSNNNINEAKSKMESLLMLFDFLMCLLTLNPAQESIKEIIKEKNDQLSQLIQKGIMHSNKNIRETFGKILIQYAKICELLKNHSFLLFLFSNCMRIFNNVIQTGIDKGSHFNFFFDFFLILFEIIYSSSSMDFKEKLNQSDIQEQEFIMNIYNLIYTNISNDDQSKVSIDILVGLVKMLTKALEHSSKLRAKIMSNDNLIEIVLTKVLFNSKQKDINSDTNDNGFIALDDLQKSQDRFASQDIKRAFFDFLLLKFNDDIANIKLFLRIQSLKDKEDSEGKINKISQPINRHFYNQSQPKSEGHVGLLNLGCICYMNSILQQMFMVPTFRYIILQSDDNKQRHLGRDDNALHQLQRMYTFLLLSVREDYNPKDFCFSFKDFDGHPVNISVQQDSQEFLNAFCDKIENSLKETMYKYIINSIFVGRTCSQVICEMCGNVSNRFEDFYTLTLEVANMSSLSDSLKKFIEPERIENFSCEQCNKKVTISKRTSFSDLPNVLIIHLKRFFMNYEIERTEKINSKLEFPNKINLKSFCIEELMHLKDPSYETDDIYYKEDDYYEYILVGINVHMGSADGGHYFSFISTKRDGKGNEGNLLEIDQSPENAAWLRFNDSSISKFNVQTINSECFGGVVERGNGFTYENCQNAYLLYYERRKKTPLKIIIQKPEDEKDIISYKEEQRQSIRKLYDISRKKREESHDQMTTSSTSLSTSPSTIPLTNLNFIFYDSSKNEYYRYESFYDLSKKINMKYYAEVNEDNSQFQQGQKKDDSYVNFYNKVIGFFQSNVKNISYENIDPDIRSDCFNILLQLLIKQLSTDLTNDSIKELKLIIHTLILFISKEKKCLHNAALTLNSSKLINDLFNVDDDFLLSDITPLIQEIIIKAYHNDETKQIALSIVDIFLQQLSSINISKLKTIKVLLCAIVNIDEEIIPKLYQENIVNKLVECFKHLFSNEVIIEVNVVSIVNLLYYLIKRSVEFNNCQYINVQHKTELNKQSYHLHNQLNCFNSNSIPILKVFYKTNQLFFSDLMLLIQENNEVVMGNTCEEICSFINDFNVSLQEEVNKLLVNIIFPLLRIQDNYQFERLYILMGYPLLIIEKPRGKYNWPCFGYHLMKDKSSPYLKYVSRSRLLLQNCLLAKITYTLATQSLNINNIEMLMIVIEEAISNYSLFKYLYLMPWESLLYNNAFEALVFLCENFNSTIKDDIFSNRLKAVKEKTLSFIDKLNTNDDQLQMYNGFKLDYLPKDIIRENIEYVVKGTLLYLIRIEYYTSIIDLTDNKTEVDFSKSNSNITVKEDNDDDNSNTIDLEKNKDNDNDSSNTDSDRNNDNDNDNDYRAGEILIDVGRRPENDCYLIKQILPNLLRNKKVVIYDKKLKNTPYIVTVVRNIIYNESLNNCKINLESIKKKNPSNNDFFPKISKNYVDSAQISDLILYHKLSHQGDYTSNDFIQIKINTSV